MDQIDPELAGDLGAGLECVKGNLINFVFASLILGLTCSRTTSHHTTLRGVITSLLHEGKYVLGYYVISYDRNVSFVLGYKCAHHHSIIF